MYGDVRISRNGRSWSVSKELIYETFPTLRVAKLAARIHAGESLSYDEHVTLEAATKEMKAC
jgi:hypothetical protein